MTFFSCFRTDVLSQIEEDLTLFFCCSGFDSPSHVEERLMTFFSCSRTDVLSQIEEDLTLFFSCSGLNNARLLSEICIFSGIGKASPGSPSPFPHD